MYRFAGMTLLAIAACARNPREAVRGGEGDADWCVTLPSLSTDPGGTSVRRVEDRVTGMTFHLVEFQGVPGTRPISRYFAYVSATEVTYAAWHSVMMTSSPQAREYGNWPVVTPSRSALAQFLIRTGHSLPTCAELRELEYRNSVWRARWFPPGPNALNTAGSEWGRLPVGIQGPGRLGLFDISANLSEYCMKDGRSATDPDSPIFSGLRAGGYHSDLGGAAAVREYGIRLVRRVPMK